MTRKFNILLENLINLAHHLKISYANTFNKNHHQEEQKCGNIIFYYTKKHGIKIYDEIFCLIQVFWCQVLQNQILELSNPLHVYIN
ncbi:hypothetical protein BpHYR1_041574 [Brachionus plicatilis]|uniref:Uncharacterized protein n=1 Tax=Brachionus plicatilis TaxID=10195 RepID=A0A3M7SRY4_BRAPC|nr:hypothetical protein BpHYR1_041574 [Brachionus plicatilis]